VKLVVVSDLHLEFGEPWDPPPEDAGDVLVLAGDIQVLKNNYDDLDDIFLAWKKPIVYVLGNHEYYVKHPMDHVSNRLAAWITNNHPHVRLLQDESCVIDGVCFFGGTMWTDFNRASAQAIAEAQTGMADYRMILNPDDTWFQPADSIALHDVFVAKLSEWLLEWFEGGPRVIVTHHAPCKNPNTQYHGSPIWPAFNSVDMGEVIKEYAIEAWIYGHTHECDDRIVSGTHVVSNQRGYPRPDGSNECKDFQEKGVVITV
jgi:predicted phosphodiesterase